MQNPIELIPFDSAYTNATAQAFLEVFTAAPWNETVSLNDILSQLRTDPQRPGFNGLLLTSGPNVVGFSWWFDITGRELADRWRPRFGPKERIPVLDGSGLFIAEMAIVPSLRNRGLGGRLVRATLEQAEPGHDWVACQTQRFAHAALALLKSAAFVDLDLKGTQVPTRVALLKTLTF